MQSSGGRVATLEERFQQGMGIRAKFGGGTPVESTVPDSRDLAPDLHRIAGDPPRFDLGT